MGNNNDKIKVLLKEYELHRNELFLQVDLYNRQTKYTYLYGSLLIAILTLILGIGTRDLSSWIGLNDPKCQGSVDLSNSFLQNNLSFKIALLALLTFTAAMAFYLVSTIMSSSYMFLILRRRMSVIEKKINSILESTELLEYESRLTQNYLEQSSYGNYSLTPHFLAGVWRIVLFLTVIVVLGAISFIILPKEICVYYIATISFIAIFLITQYILLYTKRNKENFDKFISNPGFEFRKIKKSFILGIIIGFIFFVFLIPVLYLNPNSIDPSSIRSIGLLNFSELGGKTWILLVNIFIYNIACAIFLPTLSEAPLLFYNQIPILIIIIVSSLGKGIGALVVSKTWRTFEKLAEKMKLSFLFWPKNRIEKYIKTKGFIAYFIMQAIPFMPMRSSIYIYSYVSNNKHKIFWGATIGTFFRNIIFFFLFYLGLISLKTIF